MRDRVGTQPVPPRYMGRNSMPDGTVPLPLGSGFIASLISVGGSALVYKIWNPHLEVHRAVKLLHADHIADSRERFETEIKITAKLHHPNIVEIYAVGQWNGLPYIEMELVEGWTLEELLQRRGALPLEACTAAALCVARALHVAHNHGYMIYGKEYRGIIHRDLKPANVMVSSSGAVKLMDFGIAKPVAATGRTVEGMVMGTLQYLSPEQLQGGDIDTRSDIYSFGALLYELITGVRTFSEQNLAILVTDKLNNNFRPLDSFALRLPSRLRTLVHTCLHFERDKRIQSAQELVRQLAAAHRDLTGLPPEDVMERFVCDREPVKRSVSLRKSLPRTAVAIQALSLCVLLATSGFLLYHRLPGFMTAHRPHPAVPLPAKAAPSPGRTRDAADTVGEPAEPQTKGAPAAAVKPGRSPDATRPAAAPPVGKPRTAAVMRPAEPAAAVPAAAPSRPSKPAPTIVDRLRELYGPSADIMTMIDGETKGGRFANAYELFGFLPDQAAAEKRVRLMKMRVLESGRNEKELSNFLLSQEIADGEFYIAKALQFCRAGQFDKARLFYERALKTPAEFADPALLDQSKMHCRALIATAAFDAQPGADTKKEAMDAWYEIKLRLRTAPDNRLYQRSDDEIRRINSAQAR